MLEVEHEVVGEQVGGDRVYVSERRAGEGGPVRATEQFLPPNPNPTYLVVLLDR
jgi:hypothetical protein